MSQGVGNRVREAREAKGWTQARLAELTGVSRKTVNTVENGIFLPSTMVALKLSHALGETVEALFWLTEEDGRRAPGRHDDAGALPR